MDVICTAYEEIYKKIHDPANKFSDPTSIAAKTVDQVKKLVDAWILIGFFVVEEINRIKLVLRNSQSKLLLRVSLSVDDGHINEPADQL